MRKAVLALAVASFATSALSAELTVLLDTATSRVPAHTMRELKAELDEVFKPTNLHVSVQVRDRSKRLEAPEIVVVRLKGECRMENFAQLMDEQGPLAWTHVVDGQILPFSDVGCDQLRSAVARALHGGMRKEKDRLFGRALARVIAHEIMHIVGKTHEHSDSGIFREGLSGAQLVADRFKFDPADIARLP